MCKYIFEVLIFRRSVHAFFTGKNQTVSYNHILKNRGSRIYHKLYFV
jgi:hypothetical protein